MFLCLKGDIIPSHGYVDISDIGSTEDTALICHTNRPATLSSGGNTMMHSGGEWVGPDGTAVGTRYSNEHDVPGFRRNRGPGVVRLIRYTTSRDPSLNGMTFTPPEGIYHCEVEDATLTQQTVYVGLYNSGRGIYMRKYVHVRMFVDVAIPVLVSGDITLPDGMTFTVGSDPSGASPQFTLTCISTGGPATTVTWTRDSEMLTGSTVLNNATTAQYTHTLTVTGRLGGLYTCTVANGKPSVVAVQLTVQGIAYSVVFCYHYILPLPQLPPLPLLWVCLRVDWTVY